MKVILTQNIDKVGKIGEEVVVRPGYARNFLIPQSKAVVATKENIAAVKLQRSILHAKKYEMEKRAKLCIEKIEKLSSITIIKKSGVKGKLFGSVSARDIATILTEKSGFKVSKFQIRLPNGHVLRNIGTYSIKINVYNEMFAAVNIIVSDVAVNEKRRIDR